MDLESHLRKKHFEKLIKKSLKIILLLAVMGLPIFISTHNRKRDGIARKVVPNHKNDLSERLSIMKALEKGNYEIAEHKMKKTPDLLPLLYDSLKITFAFNYLPHNDQSSNKIVGSPVLYRNEPYYLSAETAKACYLYIFQHINGRKWVVLFPNPRYSDLNNPIRRGTTRIPQGEEWIYNQNKPGKDTIYLLATHWRQKSLENILATSDEQFENQLVNYIEKQREASLLYPGIAFSEFIFSHH